MTEISKKILQTVGIEVYKIVVQILVGYILIKLSK